MPKSKAMPYQKIKQIKSNQIKQTYQKNPPMESKQRVYKKLRMRLIIYLPIMIAIFMLIAAYLVFNFTPNIFLPPDVPLTAYYKPIV